MLVLLHGHLHNQIDWIIAELRNSVRNLDLFIPNEIIATWNAVKFAEAVFVDHNDPNCPFFTGWEPLLSKYFKHMPMDYMKNFFFEIDSGVCTIRHLCNSLEEDALTFPMIEPMNFNLIRCKLIKSLWGPVVSRLSMRDTSIRISIASHVSRKKVKSFPEKYFSIRTSYVSDDPTAPVRSFDGNDIESDSGLKTCSNVPKETPKRKLHMT